MDIVYASDDHYAMIMGISILSLFENNKDMEDLRIYILADNIREENMRRIRSMGEHFHREIIRIEASDKIREIQEAGAASYVNNNIVSGSFANYLRLFPGELFPELNGNILYLDCDTLVTGSLRGLDDIRINGQYAVEMVCDCTQNDYKQFLGLPENEPYYNSGVMLINLGQWRLYRCTEQIIDHMTRVNADYPLVDQDLINIVLHDYISKIPLRYNWQTPYFLYPSYRATLSAYSLKEDCFYSREEFEEAQKDYAIVHFSGASFIRPWYSNSNHPLKQVYLRYLSESPWKDADLPVYRKQIDNYVRELMYRVLPPYVNGMISGWILKIWIHRQYLSQKSVWNNRIHHGTE